VGRRLILAGGKVHAARVAMRKHLPALASALIAALLAVPATYAVLRAYDVLFRSEPDPATIVWSAHVAMFWRLAIGGYVAGMVAPLGFMAARRDLAHTVRTLCPTVVAVAAMIGAQGLFLP
jgi:hypothetical protein